MDSHLKVVYIWLAVITVLLVIFIAVSVSGTTRLEGRINSVSKSLSDFLNAPPGIVKATEFSLVDANGIVRAKLQFREASPNGTSLVLLDKDSNSTAELGIVNHAPQICLSDKQGDTRIRLGYIPDEEEQPFLTLSDKDSDSTVRLGIQHNHASGLFMHGQDGTVRTQLSVGNDRPTFYFFDRQGKPRISLGVTNISSPDGTETRTSESTMYLFDQDGKPVWHAP